MFKFLKGKRILACLLALFVVSITVFSTVLSVGISEAVKNDTTTKTDADTTALGYDLSDANTIPASSLRFIFDDANQTATFIGIVGESGVSPVYKSWVGKTLNIPSKIKKCDYDTTYTSNTQYTVTAVDTAYNPTHDTTLQGSSFSGSTISGLGFMNSPYVEAPTIQYFGSYISALIVPDTVIEMNNFAFYGMASLVYFETPFLGTKTIQNTTEDMAKWNDCSTNQMANTFSLHSMFSPAHWSTGGASTTAQAQAQAAGYTINTSYDPAIDTTYAPVQPASPTGGFENASSDTPWYYASEDNPIYYYLPYNLKYVKVTNAPTLIKQAFWKIETLVGVEISDVTKSIGEYAFDHCKNLVSVSLPDSIGTLPQGLFDDCKSLGIDNTPIYLPSGITSVPVDCFAGCEELETVYISNTVTTIDRKAFYGCKKLENMVYFTGWKTVVVGGVDVLERNVTSKTDGLNLPTSLVKIGDQAFYDCEKFTTVDLPSTYLTYIGYAAFGGCKNITSMTLPKPGTTQYDTTSKTEVFIPDFGSIFGTSGSSSYFYPAKESAGTYYIPMSLDSITIAYATEIKSLTMAGLSYLSGSNPMGVTTIKLNKGITNLENGALAGCGALEYVELPFVGITGNDSHVGLVFGNLETQLNGSIGTGYFDHTSGCYVPLSLRSIILLGGDNIKTGSFANLLKVTTVEFATTTTVFNASVFYNTPNLTNLSVPFVGWKNDYYYPSESWHHGPYHSKLWHPPYPEYGWHWWWEYIEERNSLAWLFSTTETTNTYGNTTFQVYSYNIHWIPNTLTSVTITNAPALDTYALRNFSSLKEVTIYSETNGTILSYIEEGALGGCSSLETLNIPFIGTNTNGAGADGRDHTVGWLFGRSSYTNSYKAVQYGTTYYIPNGLKYIIVDGKQNVSTVTNSAFANMTSVEKIDFKTNKIESVKAYAFAGCTSLWNIMYGDDSYFKIINDYAFYNCIKLRQIEQFIPAYEKCYLGGDDYDVSYRLVLKPYALAGSGVLGVDFKRIESVGNYALAGCNNITSVQTTDNIGKLGNGAFADCKFLEDVTILGGQASNYLFQNCVSLVEMNLVGITTEIPEGLFDGCENLLYNGNMPGGVILDNATTKIGAYAFRNCKSLVDFEIPNTVKEIGNGAFYGCNKLGSIIIPYGTEKIGTGVFTTAIGNGFVIKVYQEESKRPTGWVTNWNCDNPVEVLDMSDASLYVFKFDSSLKGYVIVGVKYGIVLNDTVVLPRTYQSVTVRGIRTTKFMGNFGIESDVNNPDKWEFPSTFNASQELVVPFNATKNDTQNKVTKFVIPSTYQYFDEDCFKTGGRTDLYFESKPSAGAAFTASQVKGNETKFISDGIVYYGDDWSYGSDGKTPYINASKLTYTFNPNVTPKFTNIYWTQDNYWTQTIATPGVVVDQSGSGITNIIYDKDKENADGYYEYYVGSSKVLDLRSSIVTYAYKNNLQAGTATVTITVNNTEVANYNKLEKYSQLIAGNTTRTFTIDKAVIYLTLPDSSITYNEQYWDTRNAAVSLNLNQYVMGYIGVEEFKSTYTIDGYIRTSGKDAGTYQMTNALTSDYFTTNLKVYRNGVNLTNSINIYITLKVVIDPMPVDIRYTNDGDVTSYNPKASGYYEYSYAGYCVFVKPTAAAYSHSTGEYISKCKVTAENINSIYGWDPTLGQIYDAKAYITYGYTNYVLANSDIDAASGTELGYVKGQYKIIKSKITITITNSNYVIPTEYECWSFSDWSSIPWVGKKTYQLVANANESYTITGLNKTSIFEGELVTKKIAAGGGIIKSNTPGSYITDKTKNLYIDWLPRINNIIIGSDGNPYVVPFEDNSYAIYTNTGTASAPNYVSELPYYEFDYSYIDASIELKHNKFTYDYVITNTVTGVSTVVASSTVSAYTDPSTAVTYDYFQYVTDGTPLTFSILVTNVYSGHTVTAMNGTLIPDTDYTLKINNTSAKTIDFGNVIGPFTFVYSLERNNFESINKNIWIEVIKSKVQYNTLTPEYDGEDYIMDEDNFTILHHTDPDTGIREAVPFITKMGLDQTVTIEICSASHKVLTAANAPKLPGDYTIHIVATEGEFFEGCDIYVPFKITKRTVTIYVDAVDCEDGASGVSDYMYYVNGDQMHYEPSTAKLVATNGLLQGDKFSGVLWTKSGQPGIYDSSVDGDFYWSPDWMIVNPDNKNIRAYYNLVISGTFEIRLREFTVSAPNVDVEYDGTQHQIEIEVFDTISGSLMAPNTYTVYYTLTPIYNESQEEGFQGGWSLFNIAKVEPYNETIYFKIVANNYKTYYGHALLKIDALTPKYDYPLIMKEFDSAAQTTYLDKAGLTTYTFPEYYIDYTGFDQLLEFINIDPFNAKVYYSLHTYGTTSPGTYSLTAPSVKEIGKYVLFYKVECTNYTTKTGSVTFEVTENLLQDFASGAIKTLFDGTATTAIEANVTYAKAVSHSFKAMVDTSIDAVTGIQVLYSVNGGSFVVTEPSFTDAGTYNVSYVVIASGRKRVNGTFTVNIGKATLTGVTLTGASGDYNGNYYTTTLAGVDGLENLVVYYTDNTTVTYLPITDHAWSTTQLQYKNVGLYHVYVVVTAKNYNDLPLNTTIEILKATPTATYEQGKKIEYKADLVNLTDLNVQTIHDGVPVVKWYNATYTGGVWAVKKDSSMNPDILAKAPTELGYYYFEIVYKNTSNCNQITVTGYFEIVKRKVTVVYQEELEYSGAEQMPTYSISSGTKDVLAVNPSVKNSLGVGCTPLEIGEYTITWTLTVGSYNSYYEITNPVVTFKITKIKLKVQIGTAAKPEEYDWDGTKWELSWSLTEAQAQSGLGTNGDINKVWGASVKNKLLNNHVLTGYLHTYSTIKGTYIYYDPAPEDSIYYIVVNEAATPTKVYDILGNDVSNYYDISYEVYVLIALPKMTVTFNSKTTDYNGLDQTITAVLGDTMIKTGLNWYYKSDNEVSAAEDASGTWRYSGGWSTSEVKRKDVGTYKIYIMITSLSYTTYYGVATLNIVKSNLNISVDEFDVTYANKEFYATHTVNNCQTDKTLSTTTYYRVSDENITTTKLNTLYSNFDPTNEYYSLSQDPTIALTGVVEAGDYYCVVYYPETANYYASYKIDVITVKQREVIFKLATGKTPISSMGNIYDGKVRKVTLGNAFTYVEGLVTGHSFLAGSLPNTIIATESANAGFYASDNTAAAYSSSVPIHRAGFQFYEAFISNATGDNVVKNYKPIILSDDVLIEIVRADIPSGAFKLLYTTIEYDGNGPMPNYESPSDGEIDIIHIYKAENIVWSDPDSKGNKTVISADKGAEVYVGPDYEGTSLDGSVVGTYFVLCTQKQGTNYNALGYNDECLVTIIPKEVDAVWEDLTVTFNGQDQMAKAYYTDVKGVKQYLTVTALVNWVQKTGVLQAGEYYLTAQQTLDSNYHVNHLGDTEYIAFTIEKKHYTISLKDASGNNLVKELVNTPYQHYIKSTDFDGWISNLKLQKDTATPYVDGTESTYPFIRTYSGDPGAYTYYTDFEYILAVVTEDGVDVTKSIVFDIDGGVTIKSNAISYTFLYDKSNITVPYGKTYNITDFITLKNPTSFSKISITYSSNDQYSDSYDNWSASDVNSYTVYFTMQYGTETARDWFHVNITTVDSYIDFKNTLDKTYDGLSVQPSTIVSNMSGYNFNGTVNDLVYTYYKSSDLTNPYCKYSGSIFDPSYEQSFPVNCGSYVVKITSSKDTDSQNTYTQLNVEVEFTISPAKLTVNATDLEKVVFKGDSSFIFGTTVWDTKNESSGDILISSNPYIPSGYTLKVNISTSDALQRGNYVYQGTIDADPDQEGKDYAYVVTSEFTPLINQTTYVIGETEGKNIAIKWEVYKKKSDDTFDYITHNYILDLDFKLYAHYPEMNKSYYVSGQPYKLEAEIKDISVAYTNTPRYADLSFTGTGIITNATTKVGSTANAIRTAIIDSVKFDNDKTGAFTDSNPALYAQTDPGKRTVWYRLYYEGFEFYYDSYDIQINYLTRQATYDQTAAITAMAGYTVEYSEAPYYINVVDLDTSDSVYEVALYNGSTYVATLYTITRQAYNGTVLSDPIINTDKVKVKITQKNSLAETTMLNAGIYEYTVSLGESTFYLCDNTFCNGKNVIQNTIQVSRRKVLVSNKLNADSTPNASTHAYDSVIFIDDLNSSDPYSHYNFNYSDMSMASDVLVEAKIKTANSGVGMFHSSGASEAKGTIGLVSIYSAKFTKGGVDVSSNYQLVLSDVYLKITPGEILANYTKNTYTYDGTAHGIKFSSNPTNATAKYSSNGTDWSDDELTRTLAGTTEVYVMLSYPNYESKVFHWQLKIEKASVTIPLLESEYSKVYDGTKFLLPELLKSSSNIGLAEFMVTYFELDGSSETLMTAGAYPTNVGDYKIKILVPESEDGNYDSGEFTTIVHITTKGLLLDWSTSVGFEYNGTQQIPTATSTNEVFLQEIQLGHIAIEYLDGTGSSAVAGKVEVITPGDSESISVGTYRVYARIVSKDTSADFAKNFVLDSSTKSCTYSIAKRTVTITLNQNRSYVETPTAATFNYDTTLNGYKFTYLQQDADTNMIGFSAVNIVETHTIPNTNYIMCKFKTVGAYTSENQFNIKSALDDGITILDAANNDVTSNYKVKYSLNFVINYTDIQASATGYYAQYDPNKKGSITVNVETLGTGFQIKYGTTYDSSGASYVTTNPEFTNAGVYTVYYSVSKDGYTTLIGPNCYATVEITKGNVGLAFASSEEITSLNKVYDGIPVSNPAITCADTSIPQSAFTFQYYRYNDLTNVFEKTNQNIVNVGKYKLEVSIGNSDNYDNGSLSCTFEITQREITISLTNSAGKETKAYDYYRWKATLVGIANASNQVVVSILQPNSTVSTVVVDNVVSGQKFDAILQTKSANVGSYAGNDDFEFLNSVFTITSGTTDVSANYTAKCDMEVEIVKSNIEYTIATYIEDGVTYKGFKGDYDGVAHTAKVKVLNPAKAPALSYEPVDKSTINQTLNTYYTFDGTDYVEVTGIISPSSTLTYYVKHEYDPDDGAVVYYSTNQVDYSTTPISRTKAGVTTVYVKIVASNFNTVYDEYTIKIVGMASDGTLNWTIPIEYSGSEINDPIVVTMSNGAKTIKYYNASDYDDTVMALKSGATALTSKPINVGSYVVIVDVASDDEYDAFTLVSKFDIIEKEVEVVWENMEQYYTGVALLPKAYYLDVSGAQVYLDVNKGQASIINPGKYEVQATFKTDDTGSVNYELGTSKVVKVTDANPFTVKPAQVEAPVLVPGLEFKYNDNLIDELNEFAFVDTAGNAYRLAADGTILAIKSPLDGGKYQIVDYAAYPMTVTTYDVDDSVITTEPYTGSQPVYKLEISSDYNADGITITTHIAKFSLINKTNYNWKDSKTPTADISTVYKIVPASYPDDAGNTYIDIVFAPAEYEEVSSYSSLDTTGTTKYYTVSYKYVKVTDYASIDTTGATDYYTFDGSNYQIVTDPSTIDKTDTSIEYFTKKVDKYTELAKTAYSTLDTTGATKYYIMTKEAGSYSNKYTGDAIEPRFILYVKEKGTNNIVKTLSSVAYGSSLQEYTFAYSNNVNVTTPENMAKCTFTGVGNYVFSLVKNFTINEKDPEIITLVDTSEIGFITVEQDPIANTTVHIYGDDASDSPDRTSRTTAYMDNVFLGRIPESTAIKHVMAQIVDNEKCKVYRLDIDSSSPTYNEYLLVEDYDTFIATGSFIALFDDANKEIDRIYVVVFGDCDGDGEIGGGDMNQYISYNDNNLPMDLDAKMLDVCQDDSGSEPVKKYADAKYDLAFYTGMMNLRWEMNDGVLTEITEVGGSNVNTLISYNDGDVSIINGIYSITQVE